MSEKQTKIIHVQVIDGDQEEVEAIGKSLNEFKEKIEDNLDYELEFLLTNDRIELQDVRAMIENLMTLYKKQQKWYEQIEKSRENSDEK